MTVSAGAYNLSETTLPGYTAGSWSMVGGTGRTGASVTLALGQSATCTINNNDQAAHLKLVKTVTNDNGGTAVATDFTLSAAGADAHFRRYQGGAWRSASSALVLYNLVGDHSAWLHGWGSWSCVGRHAERGRASRWALGQSATCTITNDDQAGPN